MSATPSTLRRPTLGVGGLMSRVRSRAVARVALSLLGAASFIGLWAALAEWQFEPIVLPSPFAVVENMWALLQEGLVAEAFLKSLQKTLMGWFGAVALGIPIGLLMGRYRYARAFFHDLVYLLANVPLVVYAVVSLVIFGISDIGPAFVVMLLVLPAVSINVAAGVASADEGLMSMSRAFRRGSGAVTRHVVVPAVLPFLLAATRVSFADSWKLEALTETFGSASGVGFQIHKAFTSYSVLDALSWMMFFVIFVIVVERVLLAPAERRIFAWRNPGAAKDSM
jgi:NitT/TauT family transport system permease protein